MTMPGFTAENSMVRTTGQHRGNTNFADSSGRMTITPQRMKLKTVRCDCDNDVCVCDDGTVLNTWTGLL
jgi:hypothetical protein